MTSPGALQKPKKSSSKAAKGSWRERAACLAARWATSKSRPRPRLQLEQHAGDLACARRCDEADEDVETLPQRRVALLFLQKLEVGQAQRMRRLTNQLVRQQAQVRLTLALRHDCGVRRSGDAAGRPCRPAGFSVARDGGGLRAGGAARRRAARRARAEQSHDELAGLLPNTRPRRASHTFRRSGSIICRFRSIAT
eukprot:4582242-Pleurochrysis_carterae.AAC.1